MTKHEAPEKFDGLFGVDDDGDGHDQNGDEQLGFELVPTWCGLLRSM